MNWLLINFTTTQYCFLYAFVRPHGQTLHMLLISWKFSAPIIYLRKMREDHTGIGKCEINKCKRCEFASGYMLFSQKFTAFFIITFNDYGFFCFVNLIPLPDHLFVSNRSIWPKEICTSLKELPSMKFHLNVQKETGQRITTIIASTKMDLKYAVVKFFFTGQSDKTTP